MTYHARKRMRERAIDDPLLLDLIETGTLKSGEPNHYWIYKSYPDRNDNQLCAAVLLGQALIIKTVMHHFVPE
jgi:hypothetical protein